MPVTTETHVGKFLIVKRMPSSRNGNPRYEMMVACDDGEMVFFCTQPDSSLAYSVTNYAGKRVEISLRTYRGRATLTNIKMA